MGNEYRESHPEIPAANKKAKPIYQKWFHVDHYLQEVHSYIIQMPEEIDTLETYLERTYSTIHKQKGCKTLEWRSLKSFIEYLLWYFPRDQTGFIQVLFPEGMEIFNGVCH